MKFLCIDIGNSAVKYGLFNDDESEKVFSTVHGDLNDNIIAGLDFEKAFVSSVVPSINEKVIQLVKSSGIEPVVISSKSNYNLKIKYGTPETLGIDRVCGAEGALYLQKQSGYSPEDVIITVDCGTATTVNIVEYEAVFSGGMIAPGINLMFKSLNEYTSQLPLVNTHDYDGFTGKTTKGSIATGVINSTIGLINLTVSYLEKNFRNINIYLTGGSSKVISENLERHHTVIEHLNLIGLNSLAKIN